MMADPMGQPVPLETQKSTELKYKMQAEVVNRLENAFIYHKPTDDQPARYTAIREKAKELAFLICGNSKDSRERSLSLTKIEEAVMWANAGIARSE